MSKAQDPRYRDPEFVRNHPDFQMLKRIIEDFNHNNRQEYDEEAIEAELSSALIDAGILAQVALSQGENACIQMVEAAGGDPLRLDVEMAAVWTAGFQVGVKWARNRRG